MCKECCDDFIDNNKICDEDRPYENKYYNYYREKLNEVWVDDDKDTDIKDDDIVKELEAENELMKINSSDFD